MQTLSFNPTSASSGPAAAGGGLFCKFFPNADRCGTIAAPCTGDTEPCGLTISGAQRCCPSGAQAPGPTRKFTLPSGQTGKVRSHRSYRTPRGRVTFNPNTATVTTRYIRRWAPAYHGRAAIGSRGAWVELPRNETGVGVLHSPGLKARPVKVVSVEGDHALVQYRADAKPNPAYRSVVSTRRRRTRKAVVKAPSRGGVAKKMDWCRWFPNSNKCEQQIAAACPPGTEWTGYHCAPSGNPGCPSGQVECGKGITRACCDDCGDPLCGINWQAAPTGGPFGAGRRPGRVARAGARGSRKRPKPSCPSGTHRCGSFCCKNLRSSRGASMRNPGSGVITQARRQSGVILKNPVSAAEHRRRANGQSGFEKLRSAFRDLGSGKAKLVVGRQGIDVRAA